MDTRTLRRAAGILNVLMLLAITANTSAQAQTAQRCFPETGFCIDGRIREFWEQNGGLPVFGLPITPQQEEQIESKTFQVQWFERNRLELHPENPRPYDVLLGRLGVGRLEQQGRNWFMFPKSQAQIGCRFFETGHNVCGDILKAWRTSGLEFDGRRGKSEAENLGLFGLPLSHAQTETIEGKEYIVQWFERARFELHPENRPPYNVLLGLLGREVYVPPLRDVFAQVDGGQVFVFVNPPGSLDVQFDSNADCRRSGQFGLRLAYGFTGSGNGGWGVQWNNTPAGYVDVSPSTTFSFWVKGTAPNGFQIGLKDASEKEIKVEAWDYVAVSASEWRKVTIPLSRFADAGGQVNPASIRNVNIGFNQSHASGGICIDDIAFEWTLGEIFPQVDSGQVFEFVNPPGTFSAQFVEAETCRHSGQYGLRIAYSFTGDGFGGWGVQWNNAPGGHFDAARFNALTFWVRGTASNGFQIGLKDTTEHEVKTEVREYVTVSGAEWKQVIVPLNKFTDASGQVNPAAVRNMNIGFNRDHGMGDICIDDIAFQ